MISPCPNLKKAVATAALLLATATTTTVAQSPRALAFHSSDARLQASFAWAEKQALAYAHAGGADPVGPWYEAALPGRDAFCIRDVSHQTIGAELLGLGRANGNMLGRFVSSVAPSRDWAGYWEIDKTGGPSPADYVSDDDFWYNLPANFDLLDAVVKRSRWTGERPASPGDLAFFHHTVHEYMQAWQLRPDTILQRPRLLNRRLAQGKFVETRGIPSYSEGRRDFTVGVDLLAAEYRGLQSLHEALPGDPETSRRQDMAERLQAMVDDGGWLEQSGHFAGFFHAGTSDSGSGDTFVLYFGASRNPDHIRRSLDFVGAPAYWQKTNIEDESYLPAILYRYGRPEAGLAVMEDLSAPSKDRREYPEVSFAVVEGLIQGAMGVDAGPLGGEYDLQTLPQLPAKDTLAAAQNIPFRSGTVSVKHNGNRESSLENDTSASIRWKVMFQGKHAIRSNGRSAKATTAALPGGALVTWAVLSVAPHTSVSASAD